MYIFNEYIQRDIFGAVVSRSTTTHFILNLPFINYKKRLQRRLGRGVCLM